MLELYFLIVIGVFKNKVYMKCHICQNTTSHIFQTKILKKYDVSYHQCSSCRFIQTDDPFWLPEAYENIITSLDIGLISRNLYLQEQIPNIINTCFIKAKSMLDFGGGYGMFVRMMRDKGFDFYRQDIYCDNLNLDKHANIKNLSGGQKKKLVIALSLLSEPKVLLLDECFAALDVLTIKMLQETIVNLQQENTITICICDHQARDLLACVDVAMILNNGKVIAQDTPSKLVNDINAKNAYFGESFSFK